MDMEVDFVGFPEENKYYIIVILKDTNRTKRRTINEILGTDKEIEKIDGKYYININEDIFNNPEVTEFLDTIIGNNDKFDYSSWDTYRKITLNKYYIIKKNVKKEEINKHYFENRIGFSLKEPDFKFYKRYKFNFAEDTLFYDNKNFDIKDNELIKYVYHKNESVITSNKVVGDKSYMTITSTKDLVVNFLNIIFKHKEFKLSVIKCKSCGNYFLTNNGKVSYCDKLKCKDHKNISYNTGILEIDNFLEIFRTTYNKKRKDKNIKYSVFISDLQKKYNYNFKEYGIELLAYYADDNTRLIKIEEFNLQKYLSKEYLNKLKNTN